MLTFFRCCSHDLADAHFQVAKGTFESLPISESPDMGGVIFFSYPRALNWKIKNLRRKLSQKKKPEHESRRAKKGEATCKKRFYIEKVPRPLCQASIIRQPNCVTFV